MATAPLHSSTDPTATKTLREREFRPALTRRFRALKGAILVSVGYDKDFFDLRKNAATASLTASDDVHELVAAADDIDPVDERDFEFKEERGAIPAFLRWLHEQLQTGVLEATRKPTVEKGGHYTGPYIRAAAKRGWSDGGRRLVRAGMDAANIEASFDVPVAQRQLRQLYTRAYRELRGITDDVETAIREELTMGVAEGINPREMARRINDRVDAIGITRAETLARTEVVRSYNEESLRRYQEAGVEQVVAEVEFLTAPSGVCPECKALSGNTYSIAEATGLLPIHPNCRCTFVPLVGTQTPAVSEAAASVTLTAEATVSFAVSAPRHHAHAAS